jgi:tRNA-2-methylthio-N6-dimethylallyladenosine synthase
MTANMKKPLSYFIKTFGCQMNVNDSEFIAGQIEDMGYNMTADINNADIIILNTCCVRKKVEDKIYSMAGIIKQIKKEKPGLIFGICGCLAQKEKENIQKRIPAADIIFGPSQASCFKEIWEAFLENKTRKTIIYCDNRKHFRLQDISIKYKDRISAYVQIMKGCNNFCSYCIVPYTRGPEESRPTKEILNEIKKLADYNYKEIFLLGQNVNSYGNGIENHDNFLTLLSKINKISGIERIRFTTSHPKDFNLDLIKVIKDGNKICEHIHLPIQSGSDKILKKMNRKYDMKQYYNIVHYIRKYMPDASITTDAMVGFPGETEGDFEDTLQAFKNIQFDSAYTFIYSNRETTLASLFSEQISLSIKKKRLWRLIELQKDISNNKNQCLIGKTVEVLVKNKSKKGVEHQYWGKTRTNKVVVFLEKYNDVSNDKFIGQLVNVKIQRADAYTLYGEIVNAKR